MQTPFHPSRFHAVVVASGSGTPFAHANSLTGAHNIARKRAQVYTSRIIRLRSTCLVAEMAQGPRKNFTQFKAVLQPAIQGRSLADFRIYASYRGVPGQFYGTLKVVRLTDKRVLFPFEGCPEMGPFVDPQSAVDAAQRYGEQLASGDLQNPEL